MVGTGCTWRVYGPAGLNSSPPALVTAFGAPHLLHLAILPEIMDADTAIYFRQPEQRLAITATSQQLVAHTERS
jgi:hypothetical protein